MFYLVMFVFSSLSIQKNNEFLDGHIRNDLCCGGFKDNSHSSSS